MNQGHKLLDQYAHFLWEHLAWDTVTLSGLTLTVDLETSGDAFRTTSGHLPLNTFKHLMGLSESYKKRPYSDEILGQIDYYGIKFDCHLRTYKYYFPRADLDIAAMRAACAMLPGSHDWRNLCKMDVGNGVTAFIRKVEGADIIPVLDAAETNQGYEMYCLRISGNAFLWHQIRCIMGILLLIGEGNEKPEVIQQLLDVKNNPRKPQYNMALDVPLNLFECCYEITKEIDWAWDLEELKAIITTLQAKWTLTSIKAAMIRDVLEELEKQYDTSCERQNIRMNGTDNTSDVCTRSLTQCLLQGVKPRVYKPLLERDTCSSLEERIQHYVKKRRIEPPGDKLK